MYTVVIVCLLRAIKGDVSLLSLAYSSQGKQVLGLRVKLCRRIVSVLRSSCSLCFLVNAEEQQQGTALTRKVTCKLKM